MSLVHFDEISADFSAANNATADSFSFSVAVVLNASSIAPVSTGNAPIMSFIIDVKSWVFVIFPDPCGCQSGPSPVSQLTPTYMLQRSISRENTALQKNLKKRRNSAVRLDGHIGSGRIDQGRMGFIARVPGGDFLAGFEA